MIRRNLFVLLSLFVTSASFAQEFRVLEVTPSSGPSTGGTVVSIRMNQLPDCPVLPIGPSVSFGGVAVGATTSGDDTFIATAPAHAAGQVDLVISACGMDDLTVTRGFSYFHQAGSESPFRVLTVTPPSGPVAGGTEVTVQVDDIPFCFDPVPDAGLLFDGIEATNIREDQVNNTITGITPAHAAGSVNLEVRTCGGPSVLLQSGFTYNNEPDPKPGYEKVLFPVFFFGPGAHGSQWVTTISVYNPGQFTVSVRNPVFFGNPICPAGCGCGPEGQLAPGTTSVVCGQFADPAGLILYAPHVAADDLQYHARAFDMSRAAENAGTEIPVVREREFRRDVIVLQNLPLDDDFRLGLRIYNPDQRGDAQVKMQVLDAANSAVYGERTITFDFPAQILLADPWPSRPAFASIGNLHTIVREMLGAAAGSVPRVHIMITPVTPGIRFWAFATITNNDTQLITTVSPQN